MEQKKRANIICLSPLSAQQLDVVYENIRLAHTDIEVWFNEETSDIAKWAHEKSLGTKLLHSENKILFITPDPAIKLSLPENFVHPGQLIFVCEAGVSADNYLLGASYHLTGLLKNIRVSDFSFPDYIFETCLYFRKTRFFVFTKDSLRPLSGNAWQIDSFLIDHFSLKKGRLYRKLFRHLETAQITGFNKTDLKSGVMQTGKRLYSAMYGTSLFLHRIKVIFETIGNAFAIFFNMVSFKLKRKFKR